MPKHNSTAKKDEQDFTLPHHLQERLFEGLAIILGCAAFFLLMALYSYHSQDPGWFSATRHAGSIVNLGGQVGAYLADILLHAFGVMAYPFSLGFILLAWFLARNKSDDFELWEAEIAIRVLGFALVMAGGCSLMALEALPYGNAVIYSAGGVFGAALATLLVKAFNRGGTLLFCLAFSTVGLAWLFNLSWMRFVERLGELSLRLTLFSGRWILALFGASAALIKRPESVNTPPASETEGTLERDKPTLIPPKPRKMASSKPAPLVIEAQTEPLSSSSLPAQSVAPKALGTVAKPNPLAQTSVEPEEMDYTAMASIRPVATHSEDLPSLGLLDKGEPERALGGYSAEQLEQYSRDLEQHLLDFGIQADVVAVHPGPVITRFELQLAAGIKVSKLSALSKDLARSLSVTSVRVVEVIPGKTVVGLELPNQNRQIVRLSQVLSAPVYQQASSPLALVLGVDIAGHPMVVDLAKMPHLLVAGTTGSGKSVGINAMILSLLFKSSPQDVRMILVDPKMLELSVYDGIPHLLTPVVTDMKEAASALRWCVGEMERRYKLMAAMGVRNLLGFNAKITEAKQQGTPIRDPLWKPTDSMASEAPLLETMPYIVVVIDELADMMMVVGKKVEQLIARIAQKARAAGIHLILATQRPSVDVLTGLIKSNIPTRISFQVSSKIDSRTILDQQGAEALLGHGDMLYLAPGTGAPLRVHGAYVDDQEVHRVATEWRSRGEPEYIDEITELSFDGESGGEEGSGRTEESDPLYDQAVAFIMETRKASISSVQRRFKIGYNRAARLVEEMERTGLVGPLEGGFRDVLVKHSEHS